MPYCVRSETPVLVRFSYHFIIKLCDFLKFFLRWTAAATCTAWALYSLNFTTHSRLKWSGLVASRMSERDGATFLTCGSWWARTRNSWSISWRTPCRASGPGPSTFLPLSSAASTRSLWKGEKSMEGARVADTDPDPHVICIIVGSWIRIRIHIRVKSRIWIRIIVMRIRNPGRSRTGRLSSNHTNTGGGGLILPVVCRYSQLNKVLIDQFLWENPTLNSHPTEIRPSKMYRIHALFKKACLFYFFRERVTEENERLKKRVLEQEQQISLQVYPAPFICRYRILDVGSLKCLQMSASLCLNCRYPDLCFWLPRQLWFFNPHLLSSDHVLDTFSVTNVIYLASCVVSSRAWKMLCSGPESVPDP